MMVAAVEHGTGLVLGQVQVADKTNEIPAVRELTRGLGLGGRTVTLDALHAQQETAHGRVERRDCAVVDVGGPEWDGFCALHGRRQAFRIDRGRHLVKQDAGSRETAYGLTSLGPAQAGPEQIGALVRRDSVSSTSRHPSLQGRSAILAHSDRVALGVGIHELWHVVAGSVRSNWFIGLIGRRSTPTGSTEPPL